MFDAASSSAIFTGIVSGLNVIIAGTFSKVLVIFGALMGLGFAISALGRYLFGGAFVQGDKDDPDYYRKRRNQIDSEH